jgi:hypothetical protein
MLLEGRNLEQPQHPLFVRNLEQLLTSNLEQPQHIVAHRLKEVVGGWLKELPTHPYTKDCLYGMLYV